jgi:O-antigen ligase
MTRAWRASRATRNSGQVVFALVAVGVLVVTFNGIRPVPGATGADLIFVVALLGSLTLLASDWTDRPIAPIWLLTAGGLLLSAALLVGIFPARPSHAALLFPGGSAYGGVNPETATLSNNAAAIRFVGTLVVLPLLIAMAANSAQRIRLLTDVWIAGAAFGALLGALGYLGVGSIAHLVSQAEVPGTATREAGLTTHSNAFALASAMALAVAAARLGRARGRSRLYFSAVVLVLIAAIAISGSRAGLVGGLFGLVLLATLHREGRKGSVRTAVIAALLAVVVGVALAPAPPPAVERLLGSDPSAAPATQQRAAIYPAVWHEVLQRPVVGHGFEYLRGSHNIYLQLMHAGGIIALAGFILFAVGSTATGFRLGRSDAVPDSLQSLARGLVASLAVWLVAVGIVQPAIFDRYLYIPAGLIVAIWALQRGRDQIRPPSKARVSSDPHLAPGAERAVAAHAFNPGRS